MRIMSLHYLVKLSIHILHVNGSWNCKPKKHIKLLLSYLLQNEANSDDFGTCFLIKFATT